MLADMLGLGKSGVFQRKDRNVCKLEVGEPTSLVLLSSPVRPGKTVALLQNTIVGKEVHVIQKMVGC